MPRETAIATLHRLLDEPWHLLCYLEQQPGHLPIGCIRNPQGDPVCSYLEAHGMRRPQVTGTLIGVDPCTAEGSACIQTPRWLEAYISYVNRLYSQTTALTARHATAHLRFVLHQLGYHLARHDVQIRQTGDPVARQGLPSVCTVCQSLAKTQTP
jgi:hypothetical protein